MSRNSHPRFSLPGSILAGVVLMFAMPLAAQAASYTYIDQKAPYKNTGMLTALNLPKIGTTFKVQVPFTGRYLGWTWGWRLEGWCWVSYPEPYEVYYTCQLAIGVRNPDVAIPALNGFLFTSAEVRMMTPSSNHLGGELTTMSFAIPNSTELVGVKFYQQVLVGYGWGNPSLALSRGGVGVIGK